MTPDATPPGHLPRIEERAAQPYLGMRREVTDGVPAAVDTAFPALFAWMSAHEIEPAGAPFIRTLEVDHSGEPLQLEVACPVRDGVPGEGEVHADALPAGRYLTMVHVGPYRSERETDLADSRERLVGWAASRGIGYGRETDRGMAFACSVEHFRVGPVDTPDYSRWETEFAYLVIEE